MLWVCQVDADFVEEMRTLRVLAGDCQKLSTPESRLDSKEKKLWGTGRGNDMEETRAVLT